MFINWELREVHIKLVYYGPPLSGKTTNLEQLYKIVPSQRRSELVSVKTREDRTLFFDFMQLELGQVQGLIPKFKLYTVPGQVYYEATRKLVLTDADGIVFVADSSIHQLAANRQSITNLWQQLLDLGYDKVNIPFVLQCNKQDLPNVVPPDLLQRFLKLEGVPNISAVAINNAGVTETLKILVAQVMSRL